MAGQLRLKQIPIEHLVHRLVKDINSPSDENKFCIVTSVEEMDEVNVKVYGVWCSSEEEAWLAWKYKPYAQIGFVVIPKTHLQLL